MSVGIACANYDADVARRKPCLAIAPRRADDAPPMVFPNRKRLALDYNRFGGGIFNPSLIQHEGTMWGIARCEPHDQAARNADKSLNFKPMLAARGAPTPAGA